MKKILVLLFAIVIGLNLFADPVNPDQAQKIAKNFYLQMCRDKVLTSESFILAFTSKSSDAASAQGLNGEGSAVFYIFNVNQNDGFVVVAADDDVTPILG